MGDVESHGNYGTINREHSPSRYLKKQYANKYDIFKEEDEDDSNDSQRSDDDSE